VSAPLGEWAGGLALLVRRPAAAVGGAPRLAGGLRVADFDAPAPTPPAAAPDAAEEAAWLAAAEAEAASRAEEARI
jgi:hypothetical protein